MTARPLSRQLALAWGAVTLAGAALAPWLGRQIDRLPGCPFHAVTGWPCPACGSGRALAALTHGELLAALAWNPLAVGAVAGFGCLGVAALAGELAGRPLREPRVLPGWARLAVPLALVVDWIYVAWKLG